MPAPPAAVWPVVARCPGPAACGRVRTAPAAAGTLAVPAPTLGARRGRLGRRGAGHGSARRWPWLRRRSRCGSNPRDRPAARPPHPTPPADQGLDGVGLQLPKRVAPAGLVETPCHRPEEADGGRRIAQRQLQEAEHALVFHEPIAVVSHLDCEGDAAGGCSARLFDIPKESVYQRGYIQGPGRDVLQAKLFEQLGEFGGVPRGVGQSPSRHINSVSARQVRPTAG